MIKVNLVPVDILAAARQKHQMFQAAVVGVMILVVVVLVSIGHFVRLKRLETTLAYDLGELKKLEIIVAKVEELERNAAAVRSRLKVIEDLLKGRPLYPYFMSDFARSVPSGVRVKTLGTASSGAGPMKLTIAAEARNREDIAAWVRNMEGSGRFSGAELGPVTIPETGERLLSFTMTAQYTPSL